MTNDVRKVRTKGLLVKWMVSILLFVVALTGLSDVAVSSILRVAPDGGIANKYWRLRVMRLRGWWFDPEKSNPGAYITPSAIQMREIALYDRRGERVTSSATKTAEGVTAINGNGSAFNILTIGNTVNFNRPVGSGSDAVAMPDPSDEATWIGLVFRLNDLSKPVGSYRFKTSGDHSDRDPVEWELSVADSKDGPWQVVDLHREISVDEFYTRLGTAGRVSWEAYNGGYEMQLSCGLGIEAAESGSSNLVGRAEMVSGFGSDLRVFGSVASSESIMKSGSSDVEFLGSGVAKSISVSGGSLRLGDYQEGVAKRYWRWRVKKLRGYWYDPAKPKDEANVPDAITLRRFAMYGKDGTRLNLGTSDTKIKKWINANNTISVLLSLNDETKDNFNQPIGTESGKVAMPDPADESTWIGFVIELPSQIGTIYSYNLKTAGDHSDRDPLEWMLECSDSADGPWTVVDDHREDQREFIARVGTGRAGWGTFNGGLVPMKLPYGVAVVDKTCYGVDSVVSLSGGGELRLPGLQTQTGNLDIDCSSGGKISHLNIASNGRLSLRNVPPDAVFPYKLPLTWDQVANADRMEGWSVYKDGVKKGWSIKISDSSVLVTKGGIILVVR